MNSENSMSITVHNSCTIFQFGKKVPDVRREWIIKHVKLSNK